MAEIPGGSCEPCKKKKCKCDRQRPVCGQCEGTNLICKYAEGNKRGIPTGYLGTLEQRLNETEAALYQALRELQSLKRRDETICEHIPAVTSYRPRLATPQMNVNKTARMVEWKEYPLQTREEIQKWKEFFSRNEKSISENPRETSVGTVEKSGESTATQHFAGHHPLQQLPITDEHYLSKESNGLSSDEYMSAGILRPSSVAVSPGNVRFPTVSAASATFQSGQYNIPHQSYADLQSDMQNQRANLTKTSQEAGGSLSTRQNMSAEATVSNRSQQLSTTLRNVYY